MTGILDLKSEWAEQDDYILKTGWTDSQLIVYW